MHVLVYRIQDLNIQMEGRILVNVGVVLNSILPLKSKTSHDTV